MGELHLRSELSELELLAAHQSLLEEVEKRAWNADADLEHAFQLSELSRSHVRRYHALMGGEPVIPAETALSVEDAYAQLAADVQRAMADHHVRAVSAASDPSVDVFALVSTHEPGLVEDADAQADRLATLLGFEPSAAFRRIPVELCLSSRARLQGDPVLLASVLRLGPTARAVLGPLAATLPSEVTALDLAALTPGRDDTPMLTSSVAALALGSATDPAAAWGVVRQFGVQDHVTLSALARFHGLMSDVTLRDAVRVLNLDLTNTEKGVLFTRHRPLELPLEFLAALASEHGSLPSLILENSDLGGGERAALVALGSVSTGLKGLSFTPGLATLCGHLDDLTSWELVAQHGPDVVPWLVSEPSAAVACLRRIPYGEGAAGFLRLGGRVAQEVLKVHGSRALLVARLSGSDPSTQCAEVGLVLDAVPLVINPRGMGERLSRWANGDLTARLNDDSIIRLASDTLLEARRRGASHEKYPSIMSALLRKG